ncbi:aspartic peptidase domain-containing protein [Syncephalastrum racemosum]|uniref:Aspartic peptidase domain-containing protein n=1 Tax=Syncephalastrum racemosum TaxID=13706 RepID=A0A1X2H4Y4_SYNRA|nr:aspartic peptidase domain-containing protein [Syncephalastrum racemosum]
MLLFSFLVALLTGVALGEVTVPFVAVDRKGTRAPTWGRQRVGAPFVDVPLENADLAYMMNISIGTPPQPFTLLLDTGSSTTWVPIAGCGQFCGSPAHTLKTTASSTFTTDNLIFSVRYGEGFSRGFYAKDTVTLAGGVKVPNANFAVSDFNDGELTIDGADGIIGIGPDVLSSYNNPEGRVIPTLVTTMFQDKVIDKNLFSVYFAPFDPAQDNNRINGHIVFGGVNSSEAQSGEILYAPITSDANYQVRKDCVQHAY